MASRTTDRTKDAKRTDAGEGPVVVWLRNDLRLDDNPALFHAGETGRPVLALYVLEEEDVRPLGAAHRWWLHHSLEAFAKSVKKAGAPLVLRRGKAAEIVPEIVEAVGASALFVNRRYETRERAVDDRVEKALGEKASMERFTGHLLHDPERIQTKTGGYYKVYTPFLRSFEKAHGPRDPFDPVETLKGFDGRMPKSDTLKDWDLLPTRPDWSKGFAEAWTPGESAAHERFSTFCDDLLDGYVKGRETPGEDGTSRMSPYLRFGEISPHRLWHGAHDVARRRKSIPEKALQTFRQELVWRDFNYHILFHFDALPEANFNARFDRMPWRRAKSDLAAWQKGMTGYPIVDAGMRQLWEMGWMHNRVRMIVGSFLTKDLLLDWRAGEAWFWDTLVDGDIGSNTAQWQWIGGSGADAQPFFRVFNPVGQSEKFDKAGDYIRRFVPELAKLPDKAIHAPWQTDEAVLRKAGVELGKTYPKPVVDHSGARQRALDAFAETKG
ncbi:deoxyribodipyrimidine photo-lyase [Aurantimonas sp. Leaf443]|uniref:cryptochrome/photolyase family protein n=1 Tax=Aurantimonas sp. Leaf443 TaxID=1736378 RepID=UPI0006F5FA9C|nr:deoxyribodipyrimidine photo-lyase [Aurantimonas sp. Leaf443]KQT88493.1 deoxyribodipyrimidine photolyase [Aurantimonas sp. Leaf443]